MKTTTLQVITYILNCIRIRTKPCKYFQLNASYFNGQEGIFSKTEIDRLIPKAWRLQHEYDDGVYMPKYYPVFVKPEWGQNASGIFRADDAASLSKIRARIRAKIRSITRHTRSRYVIQQGASEKREFEIFSILHHVDKNRYAELTITETINSSETNPINSIYNPDTCYREITAQFSDQQKHALWQMMGKIGRFGISRTCLRADSTADILAGKFHVIEVNLFAPMPINMLDPKYSNGELWTMIQRYMHSLAKITKHRDKSLQEKPVFTKIMLYNRQHPLLNFIRARI